MIYSGYAIKFFLPGRSIKDTQEGSVSGADEINIGTQRLSYPVSAFCFFL